MKIVHTSDWHAGRVWKGLNRLPELAEILGNLRDYIEREAVDILLLTGDVFDSGVPPAKAEKVVFSFLKEVGQLGVHSVVIAGNHDSPSRIEAWGILADLVNVHAVGRPRPASQGGVIEIETKSGETAIVAAVPFAALRNLVSALELAEDDTSAMQTYADGLRRIVTLLSQSFRPDAVNLLCAHTHLDGATWSGSERKVHLGDDWAASPGALPANAHYIALGHIHKPQTVAAPAPCEYAGSPLQLDFGEAGEEKSFVVLDAAPGTPAKIHRVPYEGGTPLVTITASLAELEERKEELQEAGWLRVTVPLERPDADINRKVRDLLPNAIVVDVDLPDTDEEEAALVTLADHAPREVFAAYYEGHHAVTPDDALLSRFDILLERAHRLGGFGS